LDTDGSHALNGIRNPQSLAPSLGLKIVGATKDAAQEDDGATSFYDDEFESFEEEFEEEIEE